MLGDNGAWWGMVELNANFDVVAVITDDCNYSDWLHIVITIAKNFLIEIGQTMILDRPRRFATAARQIDELVHQVQFDAEIIA